MPTSPYRARHKCFRLPADRGESWYFARTGLLSLALVFVCALIPGQGLARDAAAVQPVDSVAASRLPAQTREAGQTESDVHPVAASGPYDNLTVNPGGTF